LGAFAPHGVSPGANFTLLPSPAFFYIGSVTARHSSSRRHPKFAACFIEWNYGTFAKGASYFRLGGHHVRHRPSFWFLFSVHRFFDVPGPIFAKLATRRGITACTVVQAVAKAISQ